MTRLCMHEAALGTARPRTQVSLGALVAGEAFVRKATVKAGRRDVHAVRGVETTLVCGVRVVKMVVREN